MSLLWFCCFPCCHPRCMFYLCPRWYDSVSSIQGTGHWGRPHAVMTRVRRSRASPGEEEVWARPSGFQADLQGVAITPRGCAFGDGFCVCCRGHWSAGLMGHVVGLELVEMSTMGGRGSEPQSVRARRFFPQGALTQMAMHFSPSCLVSGGGVH